MGAVHALRMIQVGLESVKGAEDPATEKLVVRDGTWRQIEEKATPAESFGVLAQSVELSEIARRLTEFTMTQDLSYRQVMFALSCGIKTVTPAEVTSEQDDYLWDFAPPASGDPAPDSLTMEYEEDDGSGTSVTQLTSTYGMCSRISISGSQAAELATMESDWFARGATSTPETAAIGLPAFGGGFIPGTAFRYAHATSFANLTAAPTAVAAQIIDFNWTLTTGIMPKYRLDTNEPDFSAYQFGKREVSLVLTMDLGAEAESYRAGFLATQAIKYVQLKATGAQIGSGDNYSLIIDGAYEMVEPLEFGSEQDGQSIVTITLKGIYDKTATKEFQVQLTNNVETLP